VGILQPPTLRTRRLLLRPPLPGDVDPLFALFDNWGVVQWLSGPPWPYTRQNMVDFLANPGVAAGGQPEAYCVIEYEGSAIGAVSWRMKEASHLQTRSGPNIGYWLGEPHWNRGFMTEAAGALAAHIFEKEQTATIYSGYFEGNDGSASVQRKLGFAVEGHTFLQSNPRAVELPHVNTALSRKTFAGSDHIRL
jgi:RimJ/RimL family protein N-acetyltransferase